MTWSGSTGPALGPGADGAGTDGGWSRETWSVRVLAVIQTVMGFGALLFAAFPPLPTSPRTADAVAALVASVLVAFTLLVVPRVGRWALELSVASTTVLVAVMTAQMPTAQGQVLMSLGVVMLAVYVAQYLTGRALALQLALMLGAYALALVVAPELPGAAVYVAGVSLVVLAVSWQVARLEARMRFQAMHDPLTGALNRNGLAETSALVRDVAAREGQPTTVVLADLDEFKEYNDRHGHGMGDQALVGLVRAWRPALRSGDLLCRLGGDEFALVLPGTAPAEAHDLLDRLAPLSPVAWSAGIDTWDTREDLYVALARADRLLYAAKRHRVVDLASDSSPPAPRPPAAGRPPQSR